MMKKFPAAIAVIFAHLVSGTLILLGLGVSSIHTTSLALIGSATNFNPGAVGVLLVSTAVLAAIPFAVTTSREAFVLCIAPQQVLLVLHCFSILLAFMSGHYPDGYTPEGGGFFILIDQIAWVTLGFWHTAEYAAI